MPPYPGDGRVPSATSPSMWKYYTYAFQFLDHLTMRQWLVVLLGVVLWGLFCMRGFGSRSGY